MRVLVAVDVRNFDSGRLQLANLCRGFDLQLFGIEASRQGTGSKGFQAITKTAITGRKGRKFLCLNCWLAINQHDMAAHAQAGHRLRQSHCIVERPTICHHSGRSYDPACVPFDDAAVYSRGESEVVGIDDQAAHRPV